jgi:UDP-glucose 4-epimerase
MKVLVVGGAGYIGSHMLKMLDAAKYELVTVDDLSNGHRDAVKYGQFVEGDVGDANLLDQLFSANKFDAVMHFASFIEVGESVVNPAKYYSNNFSNTLNLLNKMVQHGVTNFIFSSTAAIFGEPEYTPIDEAHPKSPINPYGKSKLMIESVLKDFNHAYGLNSVCLRYFNAAGADPEGELGERHEPETHLIPLVLQAASGRRESISIFGNDFDTPDGTCIRDYIHINDLCQAHLLSLEKLLDEDICEQFNLGNGNGYSVLEVIEAVKRISGKPFEVKIADRRSGDPAVLVADAAAARRALGWAPAYAELETIIQHAWDWEKSFNKFG